MTTNSFSLEAPLEPEILEETSLDSEHSAKNIFNLNEGFWLAKNKKTRGQGFKMKLGSKSKFISGIFMKNSPTHQKTKTFRIRRGNSEAMKLLDGELDNTDRIQVFFFWKPIKFNKLKFELRDSGHSQEGGGLAYFGLYPLEGESYSYSNPVLTP